MALKLQQKCESHDEKIGDILRELDGKKQEEQRRQRELGDIQKQLTVLQTQLSNMPHIEGRCSWLVTMNLDIRKVPFD